MPRSSDAFGSGTRACLHESLRLLTDAHRTYGHSDDGNRRLANQAFDDRLDITDDEQHRLRVAEPFATIVDEAATGKNVKRDVSTRYARSTNGSHDVACSRKTLWVELRGFEPLTSSMPWRRATNCAIAPKCSPRPAERVQG